MIVSGTAQMHASSDRGHRLHGSRDNGSDRIVVSVAPVVDDKRSGPLYSRYIAPNETDMFDVASMLTRADETLVLCNRTTTVSVTRIEYSTYVKGQER